MVAYALFSVVSQGELSIHPPALGGSLHFFFYIPFRNGLEQIKQSTIYDGCYVITTYNAHS